MTQVKPSLDFIPPAYSPIVWNVAKGAIPWWLSHNHKIVKVVIEHPEALTELYQQFQQGQTRFLLAFRHPAVADPPCIAQMLWNQLPRLAQAQGLSLRSPVHVHFIYDRGIPLWAGSQVGWGISKLGGTPIRRGTLDRVGLRSIRELFLNGQFPLAAAPEGATNGHNEIVSPLEPGIAQFGFWCQEDLYKAQRDENVALAPLGVKYSYPQAPWPQIDKLLAQLEVDSGLVETSASSMGLVTGKDLTSHQETELYQRLIALSEHLLALMEQFYSRFYQQKIAPEGAELSHRLPALLDAALSVAEQAFGITAKGNISDRCRRVEQAGWNRIFRDDIPEVNDLAPAVKGMADLVAAEAELRLWHMRLVENFVSVTGHYVAEKPSAERFADMILLLWKMITRLKGESKVKTPHLGPKVAHLKAMEPLLINDYWPRYQENRRQAVAELTQDLENALVKTVAAPG